MGSKDHDKKPPELVVSGEALSVVDSWLGVSDGGNIPVIMPLERPKNVGLGAQFLSQNAYESRRNPENTIKGMLKRKSGQEEEAASGSTTKGGAADSDDEETQRGGGSSRKAARIDPFVRATNHASVKSQKLKSGKSVLEADYASRKASKKKKKKKKKKEETSEKDTAEEK